MPRALIIIGLYLLVAALPAAGETDVRPLFKQGNVELQAGAGYGVYNNKDYGVVLLGGGYYLRDGLSVGAAAESWVGTRPQIYDISPQARYIFLDSSWQFKPYVGAFYRRTGYSAGLKPIDSAGARAGLIFPLNRRAYITGDLAYERYFGCDTSVYASCEVTYPEIGLAFTF